MFTIFDRGCASTCQGPTRREFLRVGSLGLGSLGLAGLTLPGLLRAQASTGSTSERKSVVLLFLQGGPTQHETWDPKSAAPEQYRTLVDCIQTGLPGVSFSSYF